MDNTNDMNNYGQRPTGWVGWVIFAAIIMMLAGLVDIVYGIGSLLNQNWFLYVNQQVYVVDATSGGWLLIALGTLILISGILLLAGNAFGRIMGVFLATLNIILNLAYIGIAPVWAIIGIVVNAVVLYAIAAHGGEMRRM
jgi:hypothetical protein